MPQAAAIASAMGAALAPGVGASAAGRRLKHQVQVLRRSENVSLHERRGRFALYRPA